MVRPQQQQPGNRSPFSPQPPQPQRQEQEAQSYSVRRGCTAGGNSWRGSLPTASSGAIVATANHRRPRELSTFIIRQDQIKDTVLLRIHTPDRCGRVGGSIPRIQEGEGTHGLPDTGP